MMFVLVLPITICSHCNNWIYSPPGLYLYRRYSPFRPRHRNPLLKTCKFIPQLNRNNVKSYLSKIFARQSILTLFYIYYCLSIYICMFTLFLFLRGSDEQKQKNIQKAERLIEEIDSIKVSECMKKWLLKTFSKTYFYLKGD